MSSEFTKVYLDRGVSDEWELAHSTLLGVPKFGKYDSTKALTECSINLLKEVTQNLNKNRKEYNSNLTENDIDIDLSDFITVTSKALQHLINSTSWMEGELHDFDRVELVRKLEYALSILDK